MALVTEFFHEVKEGRAKHGQVKCTYAVMDLEGVKYLQLDTYGSTNRKHPEKVSQSIRLTPNAIQQLKQIIQENGL